MKIRVIRPFGFYKRGQEFDWPDGAARLYIANGVVEPIAKCEAAIPSPVPADIETAAVDDDTETADATPKRRRRK